eukprot:GSChrysophyteH1.ASY1.ANO1.2818.1 assembled CDS
MSKWLLLQSQLKGKRESCISSSIHRFEGFDLLPRKKVLWTGFNLILEQNVGKLSSNSSDSESDLEELAIESSYLREVDRIREQCRSYFDEIDTAGFRLHLRLTAKSKVTAENFVSQLLGTSGEDLRFELENSSNKGSCSLPAQPEQQLPMKELQLSFLFSVKSSLVTPLFKQVTFWEYTVPQVSHSADGSTTESFIVRTREQPKNAGAGVKGLLSNQLHGIDNTGNIRVWVAETLLLHTLTVTTPGLLTGSRVLELGGGMTGLCGIGLALSPSAPASVTITDGHPDSVRNQRVCISMQGPQPAGSLQAKQLRWSIGDKHGDLAAITQDGSLKFDTILAADCLFFREFHDDLIWTLIHALQPSGVVLLLQPRRGSSMQEFVNKAVKHFSVEEIQSYNPQVNELQRQYASEDDTYDADIHLPVLLRLTLVI